MAIKILVNRSASDISRFAVPATNSRAQHSTADRRFLSVPLDCGAACLGLLETQNLLTLDLLRET